MSLDNEKSGLHKITLEGRCFSPQIDFYVFFSIFKTVKISHECRSVGVSSVRGKSGSKPAGKIRGISGYWKKEAADGALPLGSSGMTDGRWHLSGGAGVKMEHHFQPALDPRKQELLEARFLGARVSLVSLLVKIHPQLRAQTEDVLEPRSCVMTDYVVVAKHNYKFHSSSG
ncbi:hypothetical protein GE061_015037 [Apolygus lucorum]|uniref:Uncharacterized protein n=1 Tax=Apolygus lucorum TaxID=248454 RepID=A0A8S9XJV8_APOLU|nr:hypothetical protein GE061_015037 [Apolygus lucorum]